MSDTVEQGRAYVAKRRERGNSDTEIEQALLAAGWTAAQVAKALEPVTAPPAVALDLWQAAAAGDAARVNELLNHGGDPNAPGPEGLPLHYAAAQGQLEAAKALVQRGARLQNQNPQGKTPMHLAAERGDGEMVELLLGRRCDVDLRDADSATALHVAARVGQLEVAALLLENGADIDAEDSGGQTPLQVAAKAGQLEVASYLIEAGANLEQIDRNGLALLHTAAKSGSVEVCRLLLSRGAEINHRDNLDRTPLKLATGEAREFLEGYGAKE